MTTCRGAPADETTWLDRSAATLTAAECTDAARRAWATVATTRSPVARVVGAGAATTVDTCSTAAAWSAGSVDGVGGDGAGVLSAACTWTVATGCGAGAGAAGGAGAGAGGVGVRTGR